MRIPEVVFIFLLAVAAAAQGPPRPFSEQTFVTAIELTVRVTDAEGHTPSDLSPSDFRVLEDGVERTVIGVESLAGPAVETGSPVAPEPAPQAPVKPWEIVLWIDATTTSQATLHQALPELEARAGELTAMGPVTVIWGSPFAEVVVRETQDASALAAALRGLRSRATSDQIARIRRRVLDETDLAPPLTSAPGARGSASSAGLLRSVTASREEVRVIELSRAALLGWIGALPRRTPRALLLVGDGFDLDPAEFYVDLIQSTGASARRARSRLEQDRQAEEHARMAKALAVEGWTVVGVGGSGSSHFPDDASRSGGKRMSDFLGSNPGSRPPALLSTHPREPFLQMADASGGSVIPHAGKLDQALDDLRNRVVVTYQVPRAPDAEPRQVEVRAVRPGLEITAPKWASSTRPAALAEARAIRLLASPDAERGELPLRLELPMGPPDRKGARHGKVEATVDFLSLRRVSDRLESALLRITVAVGGGDELPIVIQASLPADLRDDRVIRWSAPLAADAERDRVAVVFEELTTGAWGGAAAALGGHSAAPLSGPEERAGSGDDPFQTGGWRFDPAEASAAARGAGKPILVFGYGASCGECTAAAGESLSHPTVERKLAAFVLLVADSRTAGSGNAPRAGELAYFAVQDPEGREHFRHSFRIGSRADERSIATAGLSEFLSRTADVAPLLAEGAAAQREGKSLPAARAFALAYRRAGELERAAEEFVHVHELSEALGDRVQMQTADVLLGLVRFQSGEGGAALRLFERVRSDPASPLNHAEALLGIGQVRRARGDEKGASEAFVEAARLAPAGSEAQRAAMALAGASSDVVRGAVTLSPETPIKPVQLVVEGRPPFRGTIEAQALIRDPRVHRVRFLLDDRELADDAAPPFVARIEIGPLPRPHRLRASATDASGAFVAEDLLILNERHDTFWLRAATVPRPGGILARFEAGEPLGRRVERIDLYLDGRLVETLNAPPWQTEIPAAPTETSVLRAVAKLDDGRAAEDAVLLNPAGYAETVDVREIQIYASVTDGQGAPVTDLRPSEFTVLEKGTPQNIEGFEFLQGAPWTAGIALDSSGSMNLGLHDAQDAARDFVSRTIENGGRAFLVDFDSTPRLAHPTSADAGAIFGAIDRIEADGGTALYDAIVFGLLQLQGVDGKRALVVLTDGEDATSRYDYRLATRVARESGATVYAIVVDPGLSLFSSRVDRLRRELETLAHATGGEAWYLRSTAGLDEIYDAIARELRNQYVLTYRTTPPKSGEEWRDVEVEVSRRGVRVKTIDGYVP